jgi:hypothetical protein
MASIWDAAVHAKQMECQLALMLVTTARQAAQGRQFAAFQHSPPAASTWRAGLTAVHVHMWQPGSTQHNSLVYIA